MILVNKRANGGLSSSLGASLHRTLILLLMSTFAISCSKKTIEADPKDPGGTNPGNNVSKSNAKNILSFEISSLSPAIKASIDTSAYTISAEVPAGTSLKSLIPRITISDKATISPASGISQDFSGEFSYTVTAEDGSVKTYKVRLTLKKDEQGTAQNSCRITSFLVLDPTGSASHQYIYKLIDKNGAKVHEGDIESDQINEYFPDGKLKRTGIKMFGYDEKGFLTGENLSYITDNTTGNFRVQQVYSTYQYANEKLAYKKTVLKYVNASLPDQVSEFYYRYDAEGILNYVKNGTVVYTISKGKVLSIKDEFNNNNYEVDSEGKLMKQQSGVLTYVYFYDQKGRLAGFELFDKNGEKILKSTRDFTDIPFNAHVSENFFTFKGIPTIPYEYGALAHLSHIKTYNYVNGKETLSSESNFEYTLNESGLIRAYKSIYKNHETNSEETTEKRFGLKCDNN